MRYWLMKSEPDVFGIEHLKQRPDHIEPWDGVRNYQVRNMIRDEMQAGDLAFFYHSNCEVPGIAGIIKLVTAGYPDHSAFDPHHRYFDPKSNANNPCWFRVDVQLVRPLKRVISLQELKQHEMLHGMKVLQKGNRLSITPVTKEQWDYILSLETAS